jgi:UDP-N-acetyl-D-glucosamine dehydrogenase
MDLLHARGAEVEYHDPYVPVIKPTREHSHWAGKKSVAWERASLARFDAALIATNHASVNYGELAEWSPCIIDTRNAMHGVKTAPDQVVKA